jgi:hypothetical protein
MGWPGQGISPSHAPTGSPFRAGQVSINQMGPYCNTSEVHKQDVCQDSAADQIRLDYMDNIMNFHMGIS